MTTILILGSAPRSRREPRLEDERRELERTLDGTPFVPEHGFGFEAADLSKLLYEHAPEIVHFIGHGTRDGELVAGGGAGTATVIDSAALATMLAHFSKTVRCVFLNACFTAEQADELARSIEVVVTAAGELDAEAAIIASTGFYRALAHGHSVQSAFEIARSEAPLRGVGAPPLVLRVRRGVDPDQEFFPRDPEPDPLRALINAIIMLLREWFTKPMLQSELRTIGLAGEVNLDATHRSIAEDAAELMVTQGRIGVGWFDRHAREARERRDFVRARAFVSVKDHWIRVRKRR